MSEGANNPLDSDEERVQRRELFISYSHKDRAFLEQFLIHLSSLADYGLIHWDDSKIKPGDIWQEEIEQALARAQVALLLVSPDFLASTFIRRKELPKLFDAAKKEGLTILWLPIRPCSWKRYPQIEQYQPVGSLEPTLADMDAAERDRAMVKITDHIHDLLEQIQQDRIAAEKTEAAEALANRHAETRGREDEECKEGVQKAEALQKQEKNEWLHRLQTDQEAQSAAERFVPKLQLHEKERKDSQKTIQSAASQLFSRPATSSPHIASPINIASSEKSQQDQIVSSSDHGAKSLESMAMVRLGDRMQRPLRYTPDCPVILMDTKMPAILGVDSDALILYQNSTMKSVRFDKTLLQKNHGSDIFVITPEDIFLPELHLLPGKDSLINSWLSQMLDGSLSINGEPTTPLLPIKPIVREIFSSAELFNMCSIDLIPNKEGIDLQITLMIPLHGSSSRYPIIQRYPVNSGNLINEDLPVIAIWPNISDTGWRYYVIFAEDRNVGVTIDGFPDYEFHRCREGQETVRYFSCERFPDLIMLTEGSQYRGLIPINPPPQNSSNTSWRVGIDFGTSYTNFFIDDGSGPHRKTLKTLVIPLTRANREIQLRLLHKYFIPETLSPNDGNPPISTALNTYGWQEIRGSLPELFHQARVQWPSTYPDNPRGPSVRTGIKWRELQYQRIFLKELALLISSNASAAGVISIEWAVTYPSAFFRNESFSYQRLWKDLCTELSALTGLKQKILADGGEGGFQTEANAFASYFGSYESRQMVHTACLHVGRSITDISIWQDNALLHQVSVPFAGHNICTDILQRKPSFIRFLFTPQLTEDFVGGDDKLRGDPNLPARLDYFLRYGSQDLLTNRIPILRSEKNKQLLCFFSLMAISFGGLYHYLGLILKALAKEEHLRQKAPMPVYIGGNGARFLHWLDEGGYFYSGCDSNLLFGTLQRDSSGFASRHKVPIPTALSSSLGDEIACGLLSKRCRLQADIDVRDDIRFSGEKLVINGLVFNALDRIVMPPEISVIEGYGLGSLDEVKRFVQNYDAALTDLRINSLLPIRELSGIDSLWDEVETEVRSICLSCVNKSINDFENPPGFILALQGLSNVLRKKWLWTF